MPIRSLIRAFVLGAMLVLASSPVLAASYAYDANGRLRAVTADSGASSEYIYDALGNILAIDDVPAGQLAIFAFVPNHGPVGTSVTISGQGFSTVPSNDTVKFNGTPATVLSSTATQIVAAVPTGATTGPLSVQVGTATASSIDDFIVTNDSAGLPPSIASFSPLVADASTPVTVTGAGFAQGSGAQAGVNLVLAAVTPAIDTQLAFTPLSYALSGPVTVQTAYGIAQSTTSLIVLPTSIGVANVVSSANLAVDGPTQQLNIGGSGKYAAAVFTAQTGQWLSLQFSQFTTTPTGYVTVNIYDPAGNLLPTARIGAANLSVHLPPALIRGTYLVLFSSDTGATSQFRVGVESNALLDTTTPLVGSTIAAGQSKRIVFAGNAGQNLGLGLTNMVLTPSSTNSFAVGLSTPIGTTVSTNSCVPTTVGCDVNITNLPATQMYGLILTPDAPATLSYTATLSNDVTATLKTNVPYALSIGRSGQNARLKFSATAAGQSYAILAGGATVSPSNSVTFKVFDPNGTQLVSTPLVNGGAGLNLPNLSTGTYTVFVDPANAATATMSLTVSSGPNFAVDGAPTNLSTTNAGQPLYLQFSGTAGQNIGLGLTGIALAPSSVNNFLVTVYKPNGAYFASNTCYSSSPGCDLNLSTLPSTGLYSVLAVPSGAATMAFTATLSSDVATTLGADAPYVLNIARAGQNGRLAFVATEGQSFALLVGGASVTPSNAASIKVLKSDGSLLTNANLANGGGAADLPSLVADTYTVFVDPAYAATATMSVTLSSGGGVTVGGAPKNFSTTSAGQPAYFQFSATAGQNLGLGFTGISITPSSVNNFLVNVYKPNGSVFAYTYCYTTNSGCELNLSGLPTTGMYGVVVTPAGAATTAFTATVSADIAPSLSLDTPYALNIGRAGQNARLTFAATAGQNRALLIGGASVAPSNTVSVKVLKSDGSVLIGTNLANGGAVLDLANLAADTYAVFIDPTFASTAAMSVTLSSGGGMSMGGAPANVATTNLGQPVYFQFGGTTGQNLGLGATGISFAPNSVTNFTLNVYKPDGSLWIYNNCYSSNPGCELNLTNLPSTGAYAITVVPSGAATMAFTLALSADLVIALPSSSATAMNIGRNGQNGRYTFSGTKATNVSIAISGIGTTPLNQNVSLKVLKPDGSTLVGTTTQTAYTFNLTNLPVTDTYTVLVDPYYAATANLTVSKTP